MKEFIAQGMLLLLLAGCAWASTPTPQPASVVVNFDLARGGSGFSLTVYAQEVTTGKSYSQPYSSGSHGGVVLPTSSPLVFTLEAPGTYIFYANLVNAPEDYHFGNTGCPPGPDCESTVYRAIDVSPGEEYQVYFSSRPGERHAPVPHPACPRHRPLAALGVWGVFGRHRRPKTPQIFLFPRPGAGARAHS